MKKFLILFVTMITSIVALAQDLIVTTDSKKIEAKIIEISSDQVKYKEYDMPDGPTFILSTKEISTIIFSSGKVILYERFLKLFHENAERRKRNERGREKPAPGER